MKTFNSTNSVGPQADATPPRASDYLMTRRKALAVCLFAIPACTTNTTGGAIPPETDWRPHFNDLNTPSILVDTSKRRLAFWSNNGNSFREFPIAVARSPELLRLGRTSVVRKKANPSWTPTPAMRRINPNLPATVPPGPDNPMGAHALYLGWQYYAIHGTDDPVSVGRETTSGCIRLFAGHIKWLYEAAPIGTRVVVV